MVRVIRAVEEMQAQAQQWRAAHKSVALVNSRGAFHRGHATLLRAARENNDIVVTSIFVDSAQFANEADWNAYPRDLEGDSRKAEAIGADVLFVPEPSELYPEGYITYVEPEQLGSRLRGAVSPDYFRRFCTTSLLMFNLVRPNRVYIGLKDAQKAIILQRMIRELRLPLEIEILPVVREQDGLAMSAMNSLLNEEERKQALVLSRALAAADELYRGGEVAAAVLKEAMAQELRKALLGTVDYVQVVDPDTLLPVERARDGVLISCAMWFGRVRISDNIILA